MNSILISMAAFIFAIGVLVTVHEFGHFWVARRLGVKVLRFSVGFGNPLWSRRFGADDTELVVANLSKGPTYLDYHYYKSLVMPELIERGIQAEKDGGPSDSE